MSRLTERLAALDRRVLGTPSNPRLDDHSDDYWNWWRVTEPRARWAALVAYAVVIAAATGLPYLVFGYAANRGVVAVVGVTYWPLTWHLYLRHRRRPEVERSK